MAFAQKPSKEVCDCSTTKVVCLSETEMADHIEHIEIEPDRMGNHSNGSGIVIVDVLFGEDGKIISGRAISGHPIGINLLVSTMSKWRFQPFVQNGKKKQACGRLSLRFKIVKNKTSVEVVKPDA